MDLEQPVDELPADYVPEQRSAPPWLMDEMVASEPALAPQILGDISSAKAIADALKRALLERLPVAIVGCGTSETAAMAIRDLLLERGSAEAGRSTLVHTRQALEATLEPWPGLCLAISHEGATRATILAMDAARGAGASTALITARSGSEAVRHADAVLVTPLIDRSWCHTVGYVSPILAGAAIAQALGGTKVDPSALQDTMRRAINLRPRARAVATALRSVERVIVIGSGPDRSPAKEVALKIEEGTRLPARMLELETLLHGHLAACDNRTGLLAIATSGNERTLRRTTLAVQAARRIGMPTAAILGAEGDADLDQSLTSAGRIALANIGAQPGLVSRLCSAAIALQLLTLELAAVRGTNPDLIGREREPYRDAARIAESDSDW